MAIEDAAALGILFSKDYFQGDVKESLAIYEEVRLPRATKVQASAAKAAYNINERIGKRVACFYGRTSNANWYFQVSQVIPTLRATRWKTNRRSSPSRK
jgi:2-polyprenyl-6-methoxyphenol hydroxylase-like FAD-dependent oxidoreductase